MANGRFLGVGATGAQANIPTLVEEGQYGGTLHIMMDTYTLLADLAAGDQIQMGAPIPEGARLLQARIATTALGGSCTINFGWLASADLSITGGETLNTASLTGFFSALPVSSATQASAFGHAQGGTFYNTLLTSSVQCVVSEQAVSSGATGGTITAEVWYISQ